jgi:membrane protein DedA with SNARE-associated domain
MAWLTAHTYAVVALSALIDATAFPFPGRVVLAAAGAVAAAGHASVLGLVALAAAATVAIDHAWYFSGALGGDRLLRVYCRVTLSSRHCEANAADWLQRFGPLVIVVGRFAGAVRVFAWPLARAHGMRYFTFLLLDVPAAVAWSTIWVGLGWLLGARWAEAPAEIRWASGVVVVGAVVLLLATRLWRRRRERRATA